MKLDDLQQLHSFVEPVLVKRRVKWDNNEGDVFILPASYGTIEDWRNEAEKPRTSELLVLCLRLGENGEEQLTPEQARALRPSLARALLNAVLEVNGMEETAQKKN